MLVCQKGPYDRCPLLLIAAAVIQIAACGEPLERYSLVTDLRVLAVRAEPPQLLADAPVALDVSFEALVVNPLGDPIEYAWSFCPVESGWACLDYQEHRDEAPRGFRDDLDAMREISISGTANPMSSSSGDDEWWSTRGEWAYDVPLFDVRAPPALYAYHQQDNLFGAGSGAWPSAILEVGSGRESIRAQKRVVLGFLHVRALAQQLGAELGIEICPEGQGPEEVPGCVPLRDATPNSNPVFARIEASEEDDASADFTPLQLDPSGKVAGVIAMNRGETIRILPVFTDASEETYQSISFDLDSGTIEVEDEKEEISVSWFCSAGKLREQLTWEKITVSLDTAYTAPDNPPVRDNGRVTIWMIARDQRGGVSWASVEVEVN